MTADAVLSRETVYRGKRVSVARLVLRNGAGREYVREVVESPGSAVVVPLLDDGGIVLVRQYRHPVGETLLELPAGTLEPGEDPAVCAERELAEETGYRTGKLTPLGVVYPSPGILGETMHLFLAEGLAQGEPDRDAGESGMRVEVLRGAEARRWARAGRIRDAKTVLGLLLTDPGFPDDG